ncbi:MAG TPA: DUF4431 domain-containing protein, partial [Xanthomonadales bacterium]|nr:DUF4431 domain-containing protein [Xanthomonadales bacterium]
GEDPASDSLHRTYVLQLPAALDTRTLSVGELAIEPSHLYYVQLVAPDGSAQHVGHKVRVTGKPFAGHTGWHRTPVLLQVDMIERIERWRSRVRSD